MPSNPLKNYPRIYSRKGHRQGKMDEFRKWISKFRCEKGVAHTHTSIGNPKISIHVPDDKMSEFYEVYSRAMVQGAKLHFTEKPNDPSPMRIDLDFRFPMPATRTEGQLPRQYTKEDVERILEAYYEILTSFIDAEDDPGMMTAYVMEKPSPVEYRGKVKDGIHVIWPNLVVPHSFQFMVRKRILDIAPTIFHGMTLCNPFQDVIDEAIIDRNNWQMYGSSKPECEKYQVTQVYTYSTETSHVAQLQSPTAVEELGFVELLSMRGKQHKVMKLKEDKCAEYEQYVKHVLPSIDERRKSKLHSQIFGNSKNLTKNFITEDDYILARQLVTECLSPRRAENYEDWIKLGWALRNIDHRLLETWMEFSKVSSKYVEGECQSQWDHMRIDTMGMGTLRWWARQDNPIKYNEIMDQSVCALIDQCANSNGAHFDVARVVHALYKDKYRFTVRDTWYTFIDARHRWVRTREGLKLRLILSCDVCTKFMERGAYWNTEASKAGERGDEVSRSLHMAKSKTITEICVKLKSAGYKNSVMTECKGLFTDENFEELLDSHPHLIGFENGVYDLKMHEFRDGLPDDYISFSTNRHYVDYHADSVDVKEIMEYMGQVFTDPAVKKYMMDVMACIIDGSIRQEKFYIFTGSGSNSKSKMLELLQRAIGDYYCILPIALLTQKRAASNAAQSELERTKGRRFAIMQEPGESEKINIGLMKELSGGDRILTRGLFKDPIEFKPQFTMIMTCNELPEVASDDGGTWRRIRVIAFTSKFVEHPDPKNPLEFPLDGELTDKFDRWADTFMSMLIYHHSQMDPKNIHEPHIVKITTEGYKKNNDLIGQYCEEMVEYNPECDERTQLIKAFMDFKAWVGDISARGCGKKIPDRNQFKAYMEKKYGVYTQKGWKGVILKSSVGDDSDVE